MTTDAGDLDLTFCPSETQGSGDLRRDAVPTEAGEHLHVLVASLANVMRSEEAASREKDRLALTRLRRLLDRLGQGEQ
jgi:hypothetical protein